MLKTPTQPTSNGMVLVPQNRTADPQLWNREKEQETRSAAEVISEAVHKELPPQQVWWRRMWKHHTMSQYRRLVALVVVVNLVFLYAGITSWDWFSSDGLALASIANIMVVNISMAILIRQQYVINFMFWVATSAPTSWPIKLRWPLGKVFHFGGIHSGGAAAGLVWFSILTAGITYQLLNGLGGISTATASVTYAILVLLIAIFVMALPPLRAKYHDNFELMHRFGGWASLLLFWAFAIFFAQDSGVPVVQTLSFWLLSVVSVSIALPWMRLKKVAVDIQRPSNHVALATFDYGVTPFAGSSTTVSRSPLTEWHSFANVPSPDRPGFRLTISRAGDWTGDLIDDAPSHVWVKGIPTAGVGNVDKLFKRVVWIATGSGIGPTLPHLLSQEVPARLIWSTRNARKTYGDELVEEILAVEPGALIWDTNEKGRPDLVKLAYAAVQEFDAEAVIVISNQKLTRQVVYGMETRGIPAYGAIWDS